MLGLCHSGFRPVLAQPLSAGFAQELVAGFLMRFAQFFSKTFADFGNRLDLSNFSYIGLHGIWK